MYTGQQDFDEASHMSNSRKPDWEEPCWTVWLIGAFNSIDLYGQSARCVDIYGVGNARHLFTAQNDEST